MTCSKCGNNNPDDFYKTGEWRRSRNLCKKCMIKFISERRLFYKWSAVKLKGGKCEKCGYDTNLAVLDFHHVDENEKDYNLSNMIQKIGKWVVIKKELEKCILLCSRCHGEIHNPNRKIDNIVFEFDHSNALDKKKRYDVKMTEKKCSFCNNVFKTQRSESKFCSYFCSREARINKNKPSSEELKLLMELNTWSKIGEKFNVSGNTVIKWAKKYGIFIDRKNRNIIRKLK